MQRTMTIVALIVSLAASAAAYPVVPVYEDRDVAADCANADPASELAGVGGDFELTADPQDPEGHLLYVSNMADGASSLVLARLDGTTGQVLQGSLTTIATNFDGQNDNGPEFVMQRDGVIGVIYSGIGGVHGVFRPQIPANWNQFQFDVFGNPIRNDNPPVLTNTSDGAYPTVSLHIPQQSDTYAQFFGSCSSRCYGNLYGGVTTDVSLQMASLGLTVSSTAQSPREGYVFMSACDLAGACGLYEGLITSGGIFFPGSVQKLAPLLRAVKLYGLAAARHPLTGSTVVFSLVESATTAKVWGQSPTGGVLKLIGSVQIDAGTHFRVELNDSEVVLNYLVFSGPDTGNYTVPVTAVGGNLAVGTNRQISTVAQGAELDWLPAANRWALYYRSSDKLKRCWVTP